MARGDGRDRSRSRDDRLALDVIGTVPAITSRWQAAPAGMTQEQRIAQLENQLAATQQQLVDVTAAVRACGHLCLRLAEHATGRHPFAPNEAVQPMPRGPPYAPRSQPIHEVYAPQEEVARPATT